MTYSLTSSGSNLTGAFKLIFKIAKNDSNDALFVETDLPELMVDALGRISPLNGECDCGCSCLYNKTISDIYSHLFHRRRA